MSSNNVGHLITSTAITLQHFAIAENWKFNVTMKTSYIASPV